MYGAVIGDIVGSIYEFNNLKSKDFPFFDSRCLFTDDTICTIAIADALLGDKDFASSLRRWAGAYPDASYGGMFRSWVRRPNMPPYNSYGNGAAMRISPVSLYAGSLDEALELAFKATAVTHNHPEGVRGACATTLAIRLAMTGLSTRDIRDAVTLKYGYDLRRSVEAIRENYQFNETSQETVPEALTCALEASDYEDAIRNAISIGGDSDTVAAIAGGLAEALFGIPDQILEEGKRRLPTGMNAILDALYAHGDHEAGKAW